MMGSQNKRFDRSPIPDPSGDSGQPDRQSARMPVMLLVDPHDDTRELYAQYLRLQGCDVDIAEDGRDALAKALARRYDVIVAETHLPGIDGYELCRLLRSDVETRHTPILFVTADAGTSEQQTRLVGADGLLVKPCLPETILEALRGIVFDGQRTERPAARPIGATNAPEGGRRRPLCRTHRRGNTTTPPNVPPPLHCPACDKVLVYEYSYLGGVSQRQPEQWDYFTCQSKCGQFEYRQRTRKLRSLPNDAPAA